MAFGGSFVKEIVIIDALRTPVGRYDGALAEYSAAELGTHVVSNLLSKHENIKSGTQYYFRIGARINIGGAKFNYVPAVRLAL